MHSAMIEWLSAAAAMAGAVLYGEDVQQPAPPIAVPTTTETLVLTSGLLTTPNPNGKAVIRGTIEMTIGAGTTGITLAMYAGTVIGGRLVGSKIPDAGDFAPGKNTSFDIELVDPFENTSGVQYCISVTQTGATGDGSVLSALIDTKVLSG